MQSRKSSIWFLRVARYHHQRIADAPWLVLGNYTAALLFLAGAAWLIKNYEYQHLANVWQPLIPVAGPALLVPAILLLGTYSVLTTRLGMLPAAVIILVNVQLHLSLMQPPIKMAGVLTIAWHVIFFPILLLLNLAIIGELSWPALRATVAITHGWAKQRMLAQRLASQRLHETTQQKIEQDYELVMLELERARLAQQVKDAQRAFADEQEFRERDRKLQLIERDVRLQKQAALLTAERAQAAKAVREANALLLEASVIEPSAAPTTESSSPASDV